MQSLRQRCPMRKLRGRLVAPARRRSGATASAELRPARAAIRRIAAALPAAARRRSAAGAYEADAAKGTLRFAAELIRGSLTLRPAVDKYVLAAHQQAQANLLHGTFGDALQRQRVEAQLVAVVRGQRLGIV